MNLLTCILIAIPIGIIFIMLWIYNDYRKYKKKNKLAILLFLLFPTTLSAQYVDAGCQVSFKWLENQKGKLEYTKDEETSRDRPPNPLGDLLPEPVQCHASVRDQLTRISLPEPPSVESTGYEWVDPPREPIRFFSLYPIR